MVKTSSLTCWKQQIEKRIAHQEKGKFTYIKLGYFFDTLNLGLSQDCFTFDRNEFCSNEDYTLKLYINEKKVDDLRNYLIWEGDLILIFYGDEDPDEIAQQISELKDREFPFDLRDSFENYLNV